MSFRTILVQLGADPQNEARMHFARRLARQFDAVLIGMHVVPSPLSMSAAMVGEASPYVSPEVIEEQRQQNAEVSQRVRADFTKVCGSDATTLWREAEGDPALLLTAASHEADIVVASQGSNSAITSSINHLVIAAGVPVLVLPALETREIGKTVLAAWNGSRKSCRAVHDGLPFLCAAERVVLCAVGNDAAAMLDDSAAMLSRHGVPVTPLRVEEHGAGIGWILLDQAHAQGVDLLVMGAYGHSRLRELVFGGATRDVLVNADLPVLFSS